jgi:lysozyme
MKFFPVRIFLLLQVLSLCAVAGNAVVNMSHYDLMRMDFMAMKREGIVGVIHEATYPRFERDAYHRERHAAASRAGLLWGAYHFGDATDPVRQADHFLRATESSDPNGVLLVLDFEKNNHYPGKSMRVDQAVAFVDRIRERTGKYPGVYMSEYRIRQMLYGPKVTPAQRLTLSNCWLWIANYHFDPRNTAPWSSWRMWQYTGDGKCDLRPSSMYPKGVANIRHAERNIFRGSNADLEAFWAAHAWRSSAE